MSEETIHAQFTVLNGVYRNHNDLMNRDLADQHPIGAITGLEDALSNIDTKEGSLSDLTTDSKTNLVSAINEVDSHADTNATKLANHIADKINPHEVTKAQVGLGNCDNTSDLNKPISTAVQSALDGKQDNLTTAQLAAVNSGIDSEKVGQISTNTNDISAIEDKIPAQASSSNQLADKNFVNSSISTATATFIGTFNSVAELEAYSGTVKNGDYAFVVSVDGQGNTVYNRYKYTTATTPESWQFEYALNNSSFTADQWAAINSGATTTNIGQIATNTSNISSLDTNKADKSTTYTKTEVDTALSGKADKATTLAGYGITDGANTALDNLNADGQMIVDSANGTISNCVLEIPQNIKLEYSNGTITLKAGSVITLAGSTYSTITTTSDITWNSTTQPNAKMYLFVTQYGYAVGLYGRCRLDKVGSGSILPANGSTYTTFFNTSDKIIYFWENDQWNATTQCYPVGIIETDENSNIKGFAKDSNGNDMIFNGACFVGHHAVIYPNNKVLIGNQFNADGTLKSIVMTSNTLSILELPTNGTGYALAITYSGSVWTYGAYTEEVEDISDIPSAWKYYNVYVKNKNVMIKNGVVANPIATFFVKYSISSSLVTDFTIRQAVRMATVEMLDKKQDTSNLVTSISSASTDTQYPSAKCVYDIVGDIETLLSQV